MVVPELVAGEAFTKLRYDRQIRGRRDARAVLAVFGMMAAAPDLFKIREMPDQSYRRAGELLANYVDQPFSYPEPILDRQTGNTAEVTDIARDYGEPIGQHD